MKLYPDPKPALRRLVLGAALLPLSLSFGQSDDEEEEVFELSPFTVEGSANTGYSGTQTLGGTRIRSELSDLAASISVITEEFLRDTGSVNSSELLTYTTNTEVGGLGGNFSGIGNSGNLGENLQSPQTNTRIRGLTEASNTRDYFQTDIPWDAYNVSGVEIQRGPNSILFGIASPAGLVNTVTEVANYENSASYENTIDRFGGLRHVFNANRVLIEDKLAVRVAVLDDHEKFRQEPAYVRQKRFFGAVKFEPRIFGEEHSALTVRANYEHGDIDSNRPRTIPPEDRITNFFDPNGLNQRLFHPQFAWAYGYQMDRGTRLNQNFPQNWTPQMGQDNPGWGRANPAFYYNADGNSLATQQYQTSSRFAIGPDGEIDNGIDGFENMIRYVSVAGMQEYSANANAANPDHFPAASKGFYKNLVVRDPGLFDFYNNLIDGNNKGEWTDWDAYNGSIAQRFWGDRVGIEYAFDYQNLTRGSDSIFSNAINVDINSHLFVGPNEGDILADWDVPADGSAPDPSTVSGGVVNPNAGRAFISGTGSGNESIIEREAQRLTAFADIHAADFFDSDSLLARIIGRNVFTGVFSRDEENTQNMGWMRFSTDTVYSEVQRLSSKLGDQSRNVTSVVYLSDDLRGSNPSTLDLSRPRFRVNPHGSFAVGYFDSNWNSEVDPGALWTRPYDDEELTQSENPENYVGWTRTPSLIYNSREGDRDQLVNSGSKQRTVIDSVGLVWQGHLFDGLIIPTYGWREDEVLDYGVSAPLVSDLTDVRAVDYDNLRPDDAPTVTGETSSWGVVVNLPKTINDRLPFDSTVRFFYGKSENFIPENRVGFDTNPLPSPEGSSEDYGFALTALDGRVSLKTTFYETTQTNAAIPGGNALGQSSWYLALEEAWGTAAAFIHENWRRGEAPGMGWYSNFAWTDDGFAYDAEELPPEGFDHPSFVKQAAAIEDWYATLPPQEYFDRLGLPVDVAAAQSSDWNVRKNMITSPEWSVSNGIGALQSSTGGLVNGLGPTGTIDQQSEGIEFELNARPVDNWNLQLNVSKSKASRGELGENFVNWIESRYERYQGPAGDLRQWWAGDRTVRQYFDDFIYSPYLFQKEAKGQAAPEIRNWRANFITTYEFKEGVFRGFRVGGGYRWEDNTILGYRLNDAKDNLDVTRPIYGGAVDGIDAWLGYSRDITDKVQWDIQVNVRDVGDDVDLVPVSVNPNGQVAAMRISEGQRWQLRNTFRF